jgi:DNA-binding NarL/FixJ family response regulator
VIRVRVAAQSAVVRAGLEALVASGPGMSLEDSYPDVVLASGSLEDVAPAPAIVLLADEAQAWTPEALRLGVRAIFQPDAGSAEILAAVDAAANGLAVLDPRELEALLAALPPHPANGNPPLTARELEVLRMMAEGDANKAIAWKLNISEHTAKFHVASILSKLNANTRTEAATMGIRKGLVLL